MHTRVDIAEGDLKQRPGHKAKKQSASVSRLTLNSKQENVDARSRKDIFRFYNLNVEIPKTFFAKLGDSKIVTSDAINLIKLFIQSEWPILAKRKRLTYRVSYDAEC